MTPLPPVLDGASKAIVAWRIDAQRYADSWDSGLGAELVGGRWNPKGVKAVYCSLDPSTCLVEAAVHRGFKVLDSQSHVLTSFEVRGRGAPYVVRPEDIPNPAWLEGGIPSPHQQEWGEALLLSRGAFVVPSAVSKRSWNLVFLSELGARHKLLTQERLSVDTRLSATR